MNRLLLVFAGLLLTAGCTTRTVSLADPATAVAPQLSVERFLRAVNSRDYVAMSRLFGTVDGPIGDTGGAFGCFWKKLGAIFGGTSCQQWREVELRLDTLAEILQQTDYQIVSERRVAGRRHPTTRISVDMVVPPNNRAAPDIGFVVVRADGRWMIECIETDKVLSGVHSGACRFR